MVMDMLTSPTQRFHLQPSTPPISSNNHLIQQWYGILASASCHRQLPRCRRPWHLPPSPPPPPEWRDRLLDQHQPQHHHHPIDHQPRNHHHHHYQTPSPTPGNINP